MYTQFFGNYLLNKKVINSSQLLEAIQSKATTHVKLGTLAIYAGLMTAAEVENLHILQTHVDKKIGQLAVEEGYLTEAEVEQLSETQSQDYLVLGQILIDQGYITTAEFEELLIEYQSLYELDDLELHDEQKDVVDALVEKFSNTDGIEMSERCLQYLTLFFNDLIRFVGDDFTPMGLHVFTEHATEYCVSQTMEGAVSVFTAIDMEESAAIAFAARYMGEDIEAFGELVPASMEDFLNMHNGLYMVNMSNAYGMELELKMLERQDQTILSGTPEFYFIPILFPFGMLNLLLAAE